MTASTRKTFCRYAFFPRSHTSPVWAKGPHDCKRRNWIVFYSSATQWPAKKASPRGLPRRTQAFLPAPDAQHSSCKPVENKYKIPDGTDDLIIQSIRSPQQQRSCPLPLAIRISFCRWAFRMLREQETFTGSSYIWYTYATQRTSHVSASLQNQVQVLHSSLS